ncbi:MAG: TetR family transcriptional regulator, partial [Burkholderiales bacterium]|nr:TetR family transcriptional regulator [Burkholderiales bacterium]
MSAVARRVPAMAPAPRADNRLPLVLDAAARLFAGKGYGATSMRVIA